MLKVRCITIIMIGIVLASTQAFSQDWTNAKPWTNDFGWLAYCPSDTTIVYGIERSGVLWKSDDAGFHWNEEPEFVPEDAGRARRLAFHPESPDTLFLLADHLYKSCNGGDSWTLVGDRVISGQPAELYYSPHHTNECLAVALGELYRSLDGGTTWNRVETEWENIGTGPDCILEIAYDPSEEGHLLGWRGYYGDNKSLMESNDGGNTWETYGSGNHEFMYVDVISIDPDDSSRIYLWAMGWGETEYGWFKMCENGRYLEAIFTGCDLVSYIGAGHWSDGAKTFYGIAPGNATGEYCDNGWHLYRSVDGMETWEMIMLDFPTESGQDFMEVGSAGIAQNPQNCESILIVTCSGTYHINDAMDETILVDKVDKTGRITGLIYDPQDLDGFYVIHEPNGLWLWDREVNKMEHKFAGHLSSIVSCQGDDPSVISSGKSVREHDCLSNSNIVYLPHNGLKCYEAIVICPTNDQKMIVAQVGWYEDEEETYVGVNRIGNDTVVPKLHKHIVSLGASHDGESIYAGGDGMYVSGDEGDTWETIDEELKINKLVAHPEYSFVFILPEADQSVGLTKYNAHTGEMTEIADGLEGAEVRDLAVSGNRLYVATSGGVRISRDLGRSWEVLEVPFTSSPTSICLSASGNHLAIGTEDDGVWDLDITDDVGEVVGNELIQEMKVYPNPFNSSTTVTIPSEMTGDVTMTLYNVLGEEIYKEVICSERQGNRICIPNAGCVVMSSGTYFVVLEDAKMRYVRKIVFVR